MVELDPAGQARQVNAAGAEEATAGAADNEAEGALLLLLSMGEKNPTGQPMLPTADSKDDEAWKGCKRE